mgnify:CR=1 FL=1
MSSNVSYFIGKNNIKWKKHSERPNVRTRSHNLVMHLPGPKASTKNLKEPIDIWKYFFDDTMLTTIVENTNKHINSESTNFSRERDTKTTDILEMQALFGLLYLAGVLKSNRLNLKDVYDMNGTGVEIFRLTMSMNRMLFLLRNLRFDDAETRNERKNIDKLAPIKGHF